MVATTYVHTLGDSTLDNLYWHMNGAGTNIEEAREKSVEGQLQQTLGREYQVVSHAYDGFTTRNVLSAGVVGAVFPWGGQKVQAYIDAKKSNHKYNYVGPLESLRQVIDAHPRAIHYVVISVGGNDFREKLLNPVQLLTDVPNVQKRYLEIFGRVKQMGSNVRPILMFQYRTDANDDPYRIYTILGVAATLPLICMAAIFAGGIALATRKISTVSGGAFILIATLALGVVTTLVPLKVTQGILKGQNPGLAMIGALMEKFYRPIVLQALRSRCPILDLPNSFNPHDHLYIAGIEPNEAAGRLIAGGLSSIINSYSDGIYRCDGNVRLNSDDWKVKYPSKRV